MLTHWILVQFCFVPHQCNMSVSPSRTSWNMRVICQAKSGMGKTVVLSFRLFINLHQVDPVAGQVAALVLCHTRVPYQICHEFERFNKYLPEIEVAVVHGGIHIRNHKHLLKSECAHIVVVAPGRIIALVRYKDLSLKHARYFIHDACGRMLESLDMCRDVQGIFKTHVGTDGSAQPGI